MAGNASGIGTLSNMAAGIGDFMQANNGIKTQIAGYQMQAAGARTAAASTLNAAYYNVKINNLNANRNLDALSRQIGGFTSRQVAQASTSGASVGSKSFLMVYNDSLNTFTRQAADMRSATKYQNQSEIYAAQSRAVAYENQARMFEWQADVASSQSKSTLAQGLINVLPKLG